jgi:hypothetical protein
MTGKSDTDLNELTENQKAILKVLADAGGDTLRGVEVRQRLQEDYNINLTRGGMNSATRRTSRYPRYMVDIGWVDDSEIEGNTRHAYHRLKEEYLDRVREQLE